MGGSGREGGGAGGESRGEWLERGGGRGEHGRGVAGGEIWGGIQRMGSHTRGSV